MSPALSKCAPERNASAGVNGETAVTAGAEAIASLDLVPSKAKAGAAAARPTPSTITRNRVSAIRITTLLTRPAGMSHRAVDGGSDLLGVFPQIAGAEFRLARLPLPPTLPEFGIRKFEV